jgi:XTP/dITP diphosphohydrolase
LKNRLLLGSGNLGKLKEIQFYLNHFSIYLGYEVITTKDLNNLIEPVEDALTFQENAKIKSQHYFHLTGLTTISDDSGFIIDGLDNYPGVKTARVAKDLGSEQDVINFIFSKFENMKQLSATFYCALSLITKDKQYNCLGKIKGKMIPEKKGTNGFGYDAFFIPNQSENTFAEMSDDKKLVSSHRFQAFKLLSSQI